MPEEMLGTSDYVARLLAAGARASGPALDKAILAGARVLLKAEQERCPVLDKRTPGSNALPPGALKAGLRIARLRGSKPTHVKIGPNGKTSHVAAFVELGHRQVHGGVSRLGKNGKAIGKGRVSGKNVPAHPFLRPAWESSKAAIKDAMVKRMKKALGEKNG